METEVLSYCRLWGWDRGAGGVEVQILSYLGNLGVLLISSPPSSLCLFCLFYKALASVLKRALQSHSLVG